MHSRKGKDTVDDLLRAASAYMYLAKIDSMMSQYSQKIGGRTSRRSHACSWPPSSSARSAPYPRSSRQLSRRAFSKPTAPRSSWQSANTTSFVPSHRRSNSTLFAKSPYPSRSHPPTSFSRRASTPFESSYPWTFPKSSRYSSLAQATALSNFTCSRTTGSRGSWNSMEVCNGLGLTGV